MVKELIYTTGGRAFALVFRAIKVVRPRRPIHPRGVSLKGTLKRDGTVRSGISWIDSAGTDDVVGRFSRSVGLPGPFPDILGLAIRLAGDKPTDILLASTGRSVPARFVLRPRRNAGRATYTSMMPYRGSHGPVLLAAFPEAPDGGPAAGVRPNLHPGLGPGLPDLPAQLDLFRERLSAAGWELGLFYASPGGAWKRFGALHLSVDPAQRDTGIRFDPLLKPLPGAGIYSWARRLREPSYATARS